MLVFPFLSHLCDIAQRENKMGLQSASAGANRNGINEQQVAANPQPPDVNNVIIMQ